LKKKTQEYFFEFEKKKNIVEIRNSLKNFSKQKLEVYEKEIENKYSNEYFLLYLKYKDQKEVMKKKDEIIINSLSNLEKKMNLLEENNNLLNNKLSFFKKNVEKVNTDMEVVNNDIIFLKKNSIKIEKLEEKNDN